MDAGNMETARPDPLDPLLKALTNWETNADLSYRLQSIFSLLDSDCRGEVGFQQVLEGFKKLGFRPAIHLTDEEWEEMTGNGKMSSPDGTVDVQQFEEIMRKQMKQYIQRRLASEVLQQENPDKGSIIDSFKYMILRIEALIDQIGEHGHASRSHTEPLHGRKACNLGADGCLGLSRTGAAREHLLKTECYGLGFRV